MSDPTPVFDDLREEREELDRLVAELSAEQWALATPAPGWSVAHQIAHLAWTDHSALPAATDTGRTVSRPAGEHGRLRGRRETADPGPWNGQHRCCRWCPAPLSAAASTTSGTAPWTCSPP
ncbi:maleylpyruvate isomerase N-terminal domain-containing protein [Streptomyces sp. NPDC005813]|uniref:maleylpyruvate isomerase N-terminal domain-containing protein n=1 Tax=Streptomyces sp. NPDC005813 TaxID=3155592 RepID=UPI0033F43A6C